MRIIDDGTTSTTTRHGSAPWSDLTVERLVVEASSPTGTEATLVDLLARLDLLGYAARKAATGGEVDEWVASAANPGLDADERRALFASFCAADSDAERAQHAAALLAGTAPVSS